MNGETIKLTPNPSFDEIDYCFESYFKQLKLLVFRAQWGEGNNYAIIDFTNGKKTYIIGRPFFSPDKKFMIVINCDIQAQYSNNGFEFYEWTNRDFKLIWSYDPKSWGPVELKWLDNTTIISRNQSIEGGKLRSTYSKITVKRKAK